MRDYQAMAAYVELRKQYPNARAVDLYGYAQSGGDGGTFEQFKCSHEFVYTGTAYGGDDDSYMGEGRCYCAKCGLDGDA